MTVQQLRDFLLQFCIENPDIADEMHIHIDSSSGTLCAKYEDDDEIIALSVSHDTFREENIIKEKKMYKN